MLIGHGEHARKLSVLKFLEMEKQVHLQQRLGIQECLIEKGRRWEGDDFPKDSLKIMSAVRMENWNLGVSFGPKDAVACGLGEGSLVNAGVMQSTPVCARRNSKWPKEWECDWDSCEASAASMLGIQSIPVRFPIAKVMKQIVGDQTEEEYCEDSMKLSTNFDLKNYQQAGCIVKTECQVQYVVKNLYDIFQERKVGRKRRWCVYLNEVDCILADFVILSVCCASRTAYPYMLFKGIVSCGWPTGYWFFHSIIDKLKHILGFKSSHAMVLNAMGYDKSDGKIILEKETNKICFTPPNDPLLPRKIEAFQKITKTLG
ncbi:hypothetical protein SLEP1_g40510 [Rubroshorea leprosula]|uniref:Uncharacterized protein n=1 Tax=Rubroshorea leprosula TaxID=152421 RepID=A0AAV5L3X6_9ROSI|nr:hypothetical protein SLEP1_g40510 [Rubroshorea leprosula]